MNSTPRMASTVRGFGVMLLLCALFLMQAAAQPRLSLDIQRLDFNGNLLKFPDGTFIVERYGELYRLTADGQFERKLAFDPTHPVPEITTYNTWFWKLLTPLADGGFFATLEFSLPYPGSFCRLARFDRDGRLVSSIDRSRRPFEVGVQLPDDRIVFGHDSVHDCSPHWAFDLWGIGSFDGVPFGSTRALALQGSKLIAAGNFSFTQSAIPTVTLLRLHSDLSLDSSFRPPLCKDVLHLAVQADGRIIVGGRLADTQGVFESEISVFRLNSDGSFERRFFQTSPDDWQAPAFAIETSGEIIILNSLNASEVLPRYPELWRYHPDGTLKEIITLPYPLPCCFGYGFDRIEFLADGSFLAHWLDENAGPTGLHPHHWVGFKADGQLHPSFPPSPFDYVNVYLSITNLVRNRPFYVEESKDLLLWEQRPSISVGEADGVVKVFVKGGMRMVEDPGPHFFRVVQ